MKCTNIHLLVVYNPMAQSARSELVWNEFEAYLCKQKIRYTCYTTLGDSSELGLSKIAILHSFSLICIVGGDGTVNLTFNALHNLDVPLLLIPAGSGNDLAKMIYPKGIPSVMALFERAILAKHVTLSVDLWRCNDRFFINGFGCGFDGSIAYTTALKKGIMGSRMKYWTEIAKHIFFFTSPRITVNGSTKRTFMLPVANGRVYGGDFRVAPNAEINDGKLDVVRIRKVWMPLRLFYLPLLVLGKHLGTGIARREQISQVAISCEQPLPAHLDGEPMLQKKYAISFVKQVEFLS